MHQETRREHILSLDCWCHPLVLAYGDSVTYDDDGNVQAVIAEDERDEERP